MLWYDKNIIHNIYFLFNNKRHGKFCYNVVTTPTSKGEFTMPPQDFTTFMLALPSECKDFSQKVDCKFNCRIVVLNFAPH
ncbi:MAG: hypothetical protein ACTTJE_07650, partial [Schwartzia sp. (in: firmicutes)]